MLDKMEGIAVWGLPEVSTPFRGTRSTERLFLFKLGVLFAEAINASGSVQKTLLASEEGVAGRTDFHMNLLALGRKHMLFMAAGAGNCGIVDFGMDVFFHQKFLTSICVMGHA